MISPGATKSGAQWRLFRKWLPKALASLLAIAAGAAEDTRPPEERFSSEIGNARNNLEWRQGELKWLTDDLENLGDFGNADLVLIRQDFARAAAAWQEVSDTYRRGEGESAKAMQRKAETLQPSGPWRTRVEARKRQADLWPADDWVLQITARWRGPMQRRWAPKFIESRRRASTAWARAAETIAAGADPRKMIESEDAAWSAEFDARAAEAIFNSNEDKDRVLHNRKVSSEELSRKLAEIEVLEKERLELARAQAETDRKRRDWERRRKAAGKDLAETYEASAKAWEAAQRKNRP
jgi:hypothetical protein